VAWELNVGDYGRILGEEARARWDRGGLLLVSQIPALLREHSIDQGDVQQGRPLLRALKADCAHQLSFFQRPDNSAVWAALPIDIGSRLQAADVFKTHETKSPSPSNAVPFRFRPWFWAAFVKSLDSGKRRWLSDDSYSDTDAERDPPSFAREVTSDDIKTPGAGRSVDKELVLASIEAWARRNQVDLKRFEISSPTEGRKSPTRRLAFENLDLSDLKRIKVPLDIVMKLLSH
jgi:hypothetical protein